MAECVAIGELPDGCLSRDAHFLAQAYREAAKSKDPRKPVGVVIVGPDGRIRAVGHNRLPGGADCPETYANKQRKRHRIVHAEAVAIAAAARAGISVEGCTSYVTFPSCSQCAGLLVEAGIVAVVWPEGAEFSADWQESIQEAAVTFADAGVETRQVSA